MAVTNYSELQAFLANKLNRSDLTSEILEFIELAEPVIKREVRTLWTEEREFATLTGGQQSIIIPTDFNGMRNIFLRGSPGNSLEQISLEKLRESSMGHTTGKPKAFAVTDDHILFGPTPDSDYQVEMTFYLFNALSDTNTTNPQLTYYPDLYIAQSLYEAYSFLHDEKRELKQEARAQRIIKSIKDDNRKLIYGHSPVKSTVIRTSVV